MVQRIGAKTFLPLILTVFGADFALARLGGVDTPVDCESLSGEAKALDGGLSDSDGTKSLKCV